MLVWEVTYFYNLYDTLKYEPYQKNPNIWSNLTMHADTTTFSSHFIHGPQIFFQTSHNIQNSLHAYFRSVCLIVSGGSIIKITWKVKSCHYCSSSQMIHSTSCNTKLLLSQSQGGNPTMLILGSIVYGINPLDHYAELPTHEYTCQ